MDEPAMIQTGLKDRMWMMILILSPPLLAVIVVEGIRFLEHLGYFFSPLAAVTVTLASSAICYSVLLSELNIRLTGPDERVRTADEPAREPGAPQVG